MLEFLGDTRNNRNAFIRWVDEQPAEKLKALAKLATAMATFFESVADGESPRSAYKDYANAQDEFRAKWEE